MAEALSTALFLRLAEAEGDCEGFRDSLHFPSADLNRERGWRKGPRGEGPKSLVLDVNGRDGDGRLMRAGGVVDFVSFFIIFFWWKRE